ncbi:MAG: carboxypeptidase-like regulatory domain-containing protein [Kofleriaceae bacterium]
MIAVLGVIAGVLVWRLHGSKPAGGPAPTAAKPSVVTATSTAAPRDTPRPPGAHDDDPTGPVRLEGQVIDDQDQPVANAEVGIDANPPKTVMTDASGSFAFDGLIQRDYRIEARSELGFAGPVRARLGDKPEPITLRLKAGGNVEVVVTDGTAPIANADVELRATVTWQAKTDAKGVAAFTHVGAVWAPLHASANGYAPAAMMLGTSGDPAAPIRVALKLSRGAAVTGKVVDAAGKPVQAWIVASSASEPFPVVDARRDGVASKPDGTFAITALAAGTWRLTASSSEAQATSAPIVLDGTHPKTDVTIVLATGATVTGKVVDKAGAPVTAANVKVVQRGWVPWRGVRQVFTRGDGSFTISGLPRLAVDVVAQSDRGSSAVTPIDLASGAGTVTLTLDVDGAIAGVVVDTSGAPVGDAQITAVSEPTGKLADLAVRGAQETVSDQGGAFQLTGLPAGRYRVRAARPGTSEDEQELAPFVVVKAGNANVKLVIAREGKLTGRVTFADGSVPLGFTVRLGNTYGTPFASTDGSFSLTTVAGTHAMVVDGQSFLAAKSRDVTIVEAKATDVGTIVVEKGRSTSGRVLDERGGTIAGAKVAAGALLTGGGAELYIPDESIGAKDTTSDANGHFRIDGFGPSPITITAGKDGAGRSASVQAPAGSDSATVDLVLAPTTGVEGKVTRSGQPLGETVVIANPIGAASSTFFVVTGVDGTFALDALAPGAYIIYPMIGGGGSKPKDMYIVRIDASIGTRTHVDLDATPGTSTVRVTATSGGQPLAMGQLFLIGATITPRSLDDLRAIDQLAIFGATAIPVHIRGVIGGAVEVEGVRPGTYTLCIAGPALACQPLVVGSGKQAVAVVVPGT